MTRPDKSRMFMGMAHLVALRSSCRRNQVGCIITDEEGTSVVSMGYNGNARGLPNDCDTTEAGACGCIHAETNALAKAPYHGVDNLVLYTTVSPCMMCAKLILNSKVQKVYYSEPYRDQEPANLLHRELTKRQGGVWLMPHFSWDSLLGLQEERNEDYRIIDHAIYLVRIAKRPDTLPSTIRNLLGRLDGMIQDSHWQRKA